MNIIFTHEKETLHLNQWLNILIIFYVTEYSFDKQYDYEMVKYEYHIYHAMIKPLSIFSKVFIAFHFGFNLFAHLI